MIGRAEPSPLRWLIGMELASYRKMTKFTLGEVGERVGMSRAKIGHLETGRYPQDPADIAALLRLYGVDRHDIDRLTSLAVRADEATWWAPWAQVVPDWFRTLVGLEALAVREFMYEPVIIPGPLQTADYAREITKGTQRVRPDHGERVVSFRIARAQRLTDTGRPLVLHAVVAEAALRLHVGSEDVRRAQYQQLITMSELPNVTIQVIRPEDGPHSAYTGSFVTLEFESVRPIGYSELHDGAVYFQDPDEVWAYTMAAENLCDVALDPSASLEFIKSLINP